MTLYRLLGLFMILLAPLSGGQNYDPAISVLPTHEAIGKELAQRIVKLIKTNHAQRKSTVLGLATGSSPIPVYKELRRLFHEDLTLDLSRVKTFNLDEYVDLPPNHPESYHTFMFTHLFTPDLLWSEKNQRGIRRENIHIPQTQLRGVPKTLREQTLASRITAYEHLLKQEGPIDLQILGIGENGHIAFAEPGSSFAGRTSIVPLTKSTRLANARFFGGKIEQVPTHAITMGIGTILEAKEIALIATGKRKAGAVWATLRQNVSEQIPASALRKHPRVTFYLDPDAATPGNTRHARAST